MMHFAHLELKFEPKQLTLQRLINIESVTGDEILILDFIESFLIKK